MWLEKTGRERDKQRGRGERERENVTWDFQRKRGERICYGFQRTVTL